MCTRLVRLVVGSLVLCLSVSAAARSGPPLLCFPVELPPGVELPFAASADVPPDAVLADTRHVLAEHDAPEVHMEALRRAVLVLQGDTGALAGLVAALRADAARAIESCAVLEARGLDTPAMRRALALARFDLALVLAAAAEGGHHAEDLGGVPALLDQALAARPHDGALQLGAALAALSVRAERLSWTWLDAALSRAEPGSRLARNVAATMGRIHGGRDLEALAAHVARRLDEV